MERKIAALATVVMAYFAIGYLQKVLRSEVKELMS